MILKVRDNKTGGMCTEIDVTNRDTIQSLRKRLQQIFSHNGDIKMHFPGITYEPKDTDYVLKHIFPGSANSNGAIVNVDLLSDIEDEKRGLSENEARNDFQAGDNHSSEHAIQDNLIVGVESFERATKVAITRNRAQDNANQRNGVFSAEGFRRAYQSAGSGRNG
ncbi:hypothetical protein F4678DRAFT_314035 [Xylaria arbuscula]|nr:hypothetical protein F4678DRAFT_314035 [Xylaria arbuscula]